MSTRETKPVVLPAGIDDLEALYALLSPALPLDLFSADLLAEKLFRNPRPQQETFQVHLAKVDDEPVGVIQSISRPADRRGWLGLFAVKASHRRRGIATAMLDFVKAQWQSEGVREVEVLAIPGNYFTPGLDPRYTEALAFLERAGFERFKDCANMLGGLAEPFDTAADVQRLAVEGVEVRRAQADDDARLVRFFEEEFGQDWLMEARLAMANDPPAIHLALRGDRIIAFSAHSTQNREWGFFGPMGTLPETRGLGIGRVLLLRCLNDLREAGHKSAVIPWVGPIAFYAYHANCRVERVFWRYRMRLD